MVQMQNCGFKMQIVLGDYDVMLARNSDNSKRIVDKYNSFLTCVPKNMSVEDIIVKLRDS